MRKIFIVAKNLFLTRISKPTYYWMILAPIFIALGAFEITQYAQSQQSSSRATVAIIAETPIKKAITSIDDKHYKISKVDDLSRAKMMVHDGSLDGVLYIKGNFKKVQFIYDNLSSATLPFTAIQNNVNSARASLTAQNLKLSANDIKNLFGTTEVEQRAYNGNMKQDKPVYNGYTGTQLFSEATTILVFFLLTSYISIAGSEIGREKGDHLLESIVASMPAKNHFAGKMIGLSFLIVFQLATYAILFGLAKLILPMFGKESWLDFSQIHGITGGYAAITILLMISTMLFYILAASLLASFVSRSEDIPQATSSVASFMLVPYLISFISQDTPNGVISTVLSYIPFTSYGIMPIRISKYSTTYTNGWIAVAISFVTVIVMYVLASRVYEKNVFNYSDIKPLQAMFNSIKKKFNK